MSRTTTDRRRAPRRQEPKRRSALPGGIPRPLPWESPLTRMWTGTKLLCLLALSTLLVLVPRWWQIGLVLGLVVITGLVARVPLSVLPRVPFWVVAVIVGGGAGAWFGGNVEAYIRAMLIGVELLLLSLWLVFTTPPARFAPTFVTLLAPLRLLRIPVGEWAAACEICLRSLPVLIGELTAVVDASRLRGGWQRHLAGRSGQRMGSFRAAIDEGIDILTASIAAAHRRGLDLGRAMTRRGGNPVIPGDRVRLGVADVGALLVTAAVVAVPLVLRR